MRFQIIRNARIESVGKSQSCMVSKLRIIWKRTRIVVAFNNVVAIMWRRRRKVRKRVRVRVDIIVHARINMYVNLSHAWFKMAD